MGDRYGKQRRDVGRPVVPDAVDRHTDNGRRSFSLTADTDVAENAVFSLQGSRVTSFDRNFNRRITQTVLSAVLQLQFFPGETR